MVRPELSMSSAGGHVPVSGAPRVRDYLADTNSSLNTALNIHNYSAAPGCYILLSLSWSIE